MRLTEEEHKALVRKRAESAISRKIDIKNHAINARAKESSSTQSEGVKRWQALGRLPKDQMNNTERAFAALLAEWQHMGTIVWWKFHPMRVRLAKNTYYEIDFLVLRSDGLIVIYETKGGYTSEKGQMKIKLCAEALPVFKIIKAVKSKSGGWNFDEF